MVELQDTPFIWMAATRHEFGYSRRMNCGQWPLSGLDYSSNAWKWAGHEYDTNGGTGRVWSLQPAFFTL